MNQRGIALPMTLMMLVLVSTLLFALTMLARSEPQIAANHMAGSQARAMAEAGVERALWALTTGKLSPGTPGSLADPLPDPVPAAYNGTQYVAVNAQGGFTVSVTPGPLPNERRITAVGYVPDRANPTAIRKIQVVAANLRWLDPPCAICAGGETPPGASTELRIGGSASVNASPASGAAYCPGVTPTAAAYSQGPVLTNGHPNLNPPPGGSPILQNQPISNFAPFMLTDTDLAMVKALAKANGTYYRGSQTFTSPPKNGILFVDTPSGNPFTNNSPSSDQITVDIHGSWSSEWSGWLVVEGSISIQGNIRMNGLVYALNDLNLNGTGGGQINGAVVSANRLDTSSTNIDTDDEGNAPLTYDCPKVRNGGGSVPQGWFVEPGTYREVSGT